MAEQLPTRPPGYRPSQDPSTGVNLKAIVITVAIIVVMVAATMLTVKGMMRHFNDQAFAGNTRLRARGVIPAVRDSRANFPDPRQQVTPREDLARFRAEEEAALNSYGWIDKTNSIVRIPITRAMELIATQGLPTRDGANPGPLGPSVLEMQQKRPLQPGATNLSPP